jgi:NADPH:quinone reductase-like Zn-dependent oxidoreductase
MKQIWITGHGGPDKLATRESPDPNPKGDELRIRVKASGINFADILARLGLYPDAPSPPMVIGYEVSGVVDAVGPDARKNWTGKEAFGLMHFGGYADTVLVPESQVFEKPRTLSHEQAVAIPVQYLTAWQLLVVMGALSSADTVLIHNAGSGLGLAAIDIARHIGATIYGTASAGKHAFLKSRGVHELIDYVNRDWSQELALLTKGRGVELIIDPVGGPSWKKSFAALRHTGRLGMFGISGATEYRLPKLLRLLRIGLSMPLFSPLTLMNKNRSVFGVNLGHLWHETGKLKAWMETMMQGVGEGWVRPHVDRIFPFERAAEAHAYIEARRNIGKVVLVP